MSVLLTISLSDQGTKLLKNIVSALEKIDSRLMIEATPNEIKFAVINEGPSAYMSVTCPAEIFKNYDLYTSKLYSVLSLMNLKFLKKAKPKESTLTLEGTSALLRLRIRFKSENGLVKTYCIPTIDGNFKETILPDSFLIKIDAKAENFLKLMSLFHSSVTRMALQATATESSGVSKIRVRSVEDPGKGNDVSALHAMVSLDPKSRFIGYENCTDYSMEVNFSVKEMRAMLEICEFLSSFVEITYTEPGEPLVTKAVNPSFQGKTMGVLLVLMTNSGKCDQAGLGAQQAAYEQENENEIRGSDAENYINDEERIPTIPNTPPEEMDDKMINLPGLIKSCCRAVRSGDHLNNVESVVAEECTVAPTLDSSMMRSKSEIRILQKPIPQNYHGIVAKVRPRSLFEASAIRVAKHSSNKKHTAGQPDTDDQGIPARFMDAYLAALRDSNVRWASESEIAGLFTEQARLIGQDKQVTIGKTAVLKRLDQGVETLIKMAGKDATLPEFEVKGPILTEALAHRYECTIKRGAFKFAFAQEFIIIGGRISQLRSIRI